MQFANRSEAGRILAASLTRFAHRKDVIVLALPRGGVPVGYKVARSLGALLDVFVVRKLGVPGQRELAMGAIASGGTRVLNSEVLSALGAGAMASVERETAIELRELQAREKRYRGDRMFPNLGGRTVLLVDDGIATGATMRAAIRAVRLLQPAAVIVAVPVAAESSCRELAAEADEVVAVFRPQTFFGVGQFYDDFRQTTDDEVRSFLEAGKSPNE